METGKSVDRRKFTFYDFNLLLFVAWFISSFFGTIDKFSFFGSTFSPDFYLAFIAFPSFAVLFLLDLRKKYEIKMVGVSLLLFYLILALKSLGNAYCLYQDNFGMFQTNTFIVWAKEAAKYLYDLFGVFYAVCMLFSLKRSQFKRMKPIFYISMLVWILFGLFQIVVFYCNNPTLNEIYDGMDLLDVFASSDTLARIRANYGYYRFYGISSEPASNAILMCCIIAPIYVILFSKIYRKSITKNLEKIYICVTFAIYLGFLYLTKSSTVYVAFLVFILFALISFFCSLNKPRKSKTKIAVITLALFSTLMVLLFQVNAISNAFAKLFDFGNGSTSHRYSTVYNDLMIFIRHPLFGCGDGNQGYFYFSNIAGTIFAKNAETQMALSGELGLLNGGATCVAFLSGQGIFGLVAAYFLIAKMRRFQTKFPKGSLEKRLVWDSIFVLFILFFTSSSIHFNTASYVVIALPFILHSDKQFRYFEITA